MARYHINPKTGNPGICRAKSSCPFGDLTADHFDSPEAARAAYEKRMETDATKEKLTKAAQEKELVIVQINGSNIRRGDVFRGEEILSASVGRKYVTLVTDKNPKILVGVDEDVPVLREQETANAKEASTKLFEARFAERAVEMRLSRFEDAHKALNESVEKYGEADGFRLSDFIQAQADAHIAREIQKRAERDNSSILEASEKVQDYYKKQLSEGSYIINTGLSRSTGVLHNVVEDAKAEAILKFVRDGIFR